MDLAPDLAELGRFDEAQPLAVEALHDLEASKGAGDLSTAFARIALARILIARGDLDAADSYLRDALPVAQARDEAVTRVILGLRDHIVALRSQTHNGK